MVTVTSLGFFTGVSSRACPSVSMWGRTLSSHFGSHQADFPSRLSSAGER